MTHSFPGHSNSYWLSLWLVDLQILLCSFHFRFFFIILMLFISLQKMLFYGRDLNLSLNVIFLSGIFDKFTFISISGSNTLNTTSLLFIDHVLAFALHLFPLASS